MRLSGIEMINPVQLNSAYSLKTKHNEAFNKQKLNDFQEKPNFVSMFLNSKTSLAFRGFSIFEPETENVDISQYFRPNIIPDEYQMKAAKALNNGNNVIVAAPTGTGKTAIAEFIAKKNLEEGKKTFYTLPMKAVNNDKFYELGELYGAENVGIMTGDVKHNIHAPIILMTTEIYRNMILNFDSDNDKMMKDLSTVVFDEFHFMNDTERGTVWEESIMHTPENVQILTLSATARNSDKIANWINKIHPERPVTLVQVPPSERHVPLIYYTDSFNSDGEEFPTLLSQWASTIPLREKAYGLPNRTKKALADFARTFDEKTDEELKDKYTFMDGIEVLESKVIYSKEMPFNDVKNVLIRKFKFSQEEVDEILPFLEVKKKTTLNKAIADNFDCRIRDKQALIEMESKRIFSVIKKLNNQDKLPAIIFKFNKRICNELALKSKTYGPDLLNQKEKTKIKELIEEYKENNSIIDPTFDENMLLKGYATHHSGMLPNYKKFVEQLFKQKLLKVAFATDTLAVGINMPAKTVVLADLEKFDGQVRRQLTSTEFMQMAGRAGRRGLDKVGNVIILPKSNGEYISAVNLAMSPPDNIISNFKPSYDFLLKYLMFEPDYSKLTNSCQKSFAVYQKPTEATLITKKFDVLKDTLEKYGYITNVGNNNYNIEAKGFIAQSFNGINPILMTELILDREFSSLSPEGMAGLVAALVAGTEFPQRFDGKSSQHSERHNHNNDNVHNNRHSYGKHDKFKKHNTNRFSKNETEQPKTDFFRLPLTREYMDKDMPIIKDYLKISKDIMKELSPLENKEADEQKIINFNPKMANIIASWVGSPNKNSKSAWERCFNEFQDTTGSKFAGDIFKLASRTIDCLNQAKKVAIECAQNPEYADLQDWNMIERKIDEAILDFKRPPFTFLDSEISEKELPKLTLIGNAPIFNDEPKEVGL